MKVAICDDDSLCREQIFSLLEEYRGRQNHEISVSIYEQPAALVDAAIRSGGFDIYILDIIMPGINGIQLGTELRQHDPEGKIIYLTSSQEYAIDSYRVKAFDYILKPVQKEKLFSALDEAISMISNKKEKGFIVKTKENSIKITFDSLVYAELAERKIVYHLTNGSTVKSSSVRKTFAECIQELLADGRFVLCNPGVAVNLYYVSMTDSDTLYFKNGQSLYIGKRAGRDIRSVWSDFWLNGEGSK